MKIGSTFAVVTGGANGIGKEITIALLEEGSKVTFIDIDEEQGKKTESELQQKYGLSQVTFINCDITNKAKLEDVLRKEASRNEGLDILCNNAGVSRNEDDDSWQEMIDINLTALIRSTLIAVELMDKTKEGRGGTIINIASRAGLRPAPSEPVYAASKHGVVGFTRSLAEASLEKGVRLNMICPALVDTQLIRNTSNKKLREAVEKEGSVSPKLVAEGFIQLVKTDNRNGEAMTISLTDGISFHEFK